MSYFQFDFLIGILALQGLIADILLLFGFILVVYAWISDRKLSRKQEQIEAREYEGLKQALFATIETQFREDDRGDGTPAYL